jgi:hypothetical protein
MRAFAHSNLAASTLDPIRELELARSINAINNSDRFLVQSLVRADPNFINLRWDENQTDAGGERGFALLGWRDLDAASNNRGLSELPLRRVRRANSSLLSLGQLQQANLAAYSWQPGFALGNSEASPHVDRARAAGLQSYEVRSASSSGAMIWRDARPVGARTFPNDAGNRFLDLSYVLNENLWDGTFLSSVPQSGAVATDNSVPLRNSRHRFHGASVPEVSEVRDFATAAAHLHNMGALNVNSASVEAWKALFTAFRGLAIEGDGQSNPAATVPVSRTLDPQAGPVRFTETTRVAADYGANATGPRDHGRLFLGFRYLSDEQIQRLSERVVDEVRLRGPFFSVADFVNRRLVAPDATGSAWEQARTSNQLSATEAQTKAHTIGAGYDPLVGLAGINGALQRAINVSGINGGMNYPYNADDAAGQNDRVFRVDRDETNGISGRPMQQYASAANYLDTEHLAGVPVGEAGQLLSHAPGFVTQADLLGMIGSALVARGDTFLVRTYGDTINPATGERVARAWLEAVVQRVVAPVTPAGASGAARYEPADAFGRRFEVVALRWLGADDI